jgi:hypothetical protein
VHFWLITIGFIRNEPVTILNANVGGLLEPDCCNDGNKSGVTIREPLGDPSLQWISTLSGQSAHNHLLLIFRVDICGRIEKGLHLIGQVVRVILLQLVPLVNQRCDLLLNKSSTKLAHTGIGLGASVYMITQGPIVHTIFASSPR